MINFLTKKNLSQKIIIFSLANIISFSAVSQEANKNFLNKNLNLETIVKKEKFQLMPESTVSLTKKENKTKIEVISYFGKLMSRSSIEKQTHVITTSEIDWNRVLGGRARGEYLNVKFDLYMKRSKKKHNLGGKLSYWRTGLFKLDSLSGFETGYEFDLIPEGSEEAKQNTFRYWNRLRMGTYIIAQTNISNSKKTEDVLDMVDAEMTIWYLHIPQKLRGDQTLSKRRGYVSAFLGIKTNHDKVISLGIKPSGRAWIRAKYQDKHYNNSTIYKSIGLDVEILTNKNGYKQSLTNLTKDYYKGFSFIIGGRYNFVNNNPYINLGLRFATRNH